MVIDKVNKIMIKNTTTGQYDTADIAASAENITFDSQGTNLESEDVESAIKEVYGAIPANTSQLINDSNFVVSSSPLADVATSGDYDDLSNKPDLKAVATSGDYDDLFNKPVLANVATSGSYNDLFNKPTIPSIEANPSGSATDTLTKLEVDGTVYNVASGSGGSTVAWNQIQTSTSATKIAEISIDGTSTDVYAPSGGGGGSSTLASLSDVNLTSPTNGQALIYDNTNSEWVNGTITGSLPVVTSADEGKVLTVNSSGIWDAESPSSGGGGINYSTTEQDTGLKWIDNKTIYQKTFINTNLQHDYNYDGAYNLGTMPTFESLVGYEGFACESTGVGWVGLNGIEDVTGWRFGFHVTNGVVLLYPAGGTPSQMSVIEGGKAWVTIKYTKPTT